MDGSLALAHEIISRCRRLASHTEAPGVLTRTFLSEPMRQVHADVRGWMELAGMSVSVDDAGNIRGRYSGATPGAPCLVIGSHLDTVPNAGAFDGPVGVAAGIALVQLLEGRRLRFPVEVVGFSEEEGVRFSVPFIGSRAFIGDLDIALLAAQDSNGVTVSQAIHDFGLNSDETRNAAIAGPVAGYLEIHIEQGPVLESLGLPLGVVETIVGQSRVQIQFSGLANHAGTTPMHLRHDALACAAEWIGAVEREASAAQDLVATVGRIEVIPGAVNVIPGDATLSLDVRHPDDVVRRDVVKRLLGCAAQIAARRGLTVTSEVRLGQPAATMDPHLVDVLADAVRRCGYPVHRMHSGAGHDAMIVARRMPASMLFLRSPGGISHHPDERVLVEDVVAALETGARFIEALDCMEEGRS